MALMAGRLEGKVCVITGAGGGMGADAAVDPRLQNPNVALAKITGENTGPDVLFECIGAAGTLAEAVNYARRGGRVVVIGVCMEEDHWGPIAAMNKELDLRFSLGLEPGEIETTIAMLAAGCEKGYVYIRAEYPLAQERMRDAIATSGVDNEQRIGAGAYVCGEATAVFHSREGTLRQPRNQKIEVQIRTRAMHEVAEAGVAAHWMYKEGHAAAEDVQRFRWGQDLLEILENSSAPDEFLENTKLELYDDQVFCFTPKGKLIQLPRGATPVDFAYAVHSQVGDSCVGAKVNGRIAPLSRELRNGDTVEVLTNARQRPNRDWLAFVKTSRARTRRIFALDNRGIAAATVAAESARIGEARSTYEDGILSRVNKVAASLGIEAGMSAREFVAIIRKNRSQGREGR